MMVERPTGLTWEGDLDGSLEPCWRQPLTAIALIVSDVKDKAKGLDLTQLADRLGAKVAPTQAGNLQKARSNQGVDGSQDLRAAVQRRPWVDYLRGRVAGVLPSPSDQLVPTSEPHLTSEAPVLPLVQPPSPRPRGLDCLGSGSMSQVPLVHVFQPSFDKDAPASVSGRRSSEALARPRRRAGEFQRSSDFARDAATDAAGPRMVPSGDRIRSRDRRRSSEAQHRASEDRGGSRDLGGSREARRRSSERRSSGGSRRRSSGGKLEKAGAKRDLVLRRRLALERAWRDTGVGAEAASELELQGAAAVATDVEAEFSNTELDQRVRVFRGQTAPPGG